MAVVEGVLYIRRGRFLSTQRRGPDGYSTRLYLNKVTRWRIEAGDFIPSPSYPSTMTRKHISLFNSLQGEAGSFDRSTAKHLIETRGLCSSFSSLFNRGSHLRFEDLFVPVQTSRVLAYREASYPNLEDNWVEDLRCPSSPQVNYYYNQTCILLGPKIERLSIPSVKLTNCTAFY